MWSYFVDYWLGFCVGCQAMHHIVCMILWKYLEELEHKSKQVLITVQLCLCNLQVYSCKMKFVRRYWDAMEFRQLFCIRTICSSLSFWYFSLWWSSIASFSWMGDKSLPKYFTLICYTFNHHIKGNESLQREVWLARLGSY